ncbi:MAG: phospho-N-acetylmuramoyl-pentapeptide-transferase [Candidatus Sumerlaeia bacterium]
MFYALIELFFQDKSDATPQAFGAITFRAACALIFAFIASMVLGPMVIRMLRQFKLGQQVRQFKTEETKQFNIHQHKAGTPTMGGVLIVASILISVLLFGDLKNSYLWAATLVLLVTSLLGFWDDYQKVARKNHKGVSAKTKLAVQLLVGIGLGAFLYFSDSHSTYYVLTETVKDVEMPTRGDQHLVIPFFKSIYPSLGVFFILWVAFVITATSNAANLTDGLDGLAIGTTITVTLPYLLITYLASHIFFAKYLLIPHVPQAGELSVILGALLGASMGFLWFNAHPAEVFMGDTGSLSIGALIGTVAVLAKHEIILVLIGGIFVVEALSVVLQVGSYKLRGKRVLLMSPLHNHFVKAGIDESKIIARFLIISILLALAGLSTLKLR